MPVLVNILPDRTCVKSSEKLIYNSRATQQKMYSQPALTCSKLAI